MGRPLEAEQQALVEELLHKKLERWEALEAKR
jgi:hypothetical protein